MREKKRDMPGSTNQTQEAVKVKRHGKKNKNKKAKDKNRLT